MTSECPICGKMIDQQTIEQHVENHFMEEQQEQLNEDIEFAKQLQNDMGNDLNENDQNNRGNQNNHQNNNRVGWEDGGEGDFDSSNEDGDDFRKSENIEINWSVPMVYGVRPSPRYLSSSCITPEDNCVYLFGGYSKISHKTLNDLHKFDTKNLSWTEITEIKGDIPTPRAGQTLTYVGNSKLLLYGGMDNDEENMYRDLYIFDLNLNAWSKLDVEAPNGVYGHSCNYIEGMCYIFGGALEDTTFSKSILKFDLQNLKIQDITPLTVGSKPSELFIHQTWSVGENLYIMGGLKGGDDVNLDLFILNTKSLLWRFPPYKTDLSDFLEGDSELSESNILPIPIGGFVLAIGKKNEEAILNLQDMTWTIPKVQGIYPPSMFYSHAYLVEDKIFFFWFSKEIEEETKEPIEVFLLETNLLPQTLTSHCLHTIARDFERIPNSSFLTSFPPKLLTSLAHIMIGSPTFNPDYFTIFKDIHEINFSFDNRVDESWLEMLLATSKNKLMSLSLRGCKNIKGDGFKIIQHFGELNSLDLHGTKVGDEDFLVLLSSFNKLMYLDISDCRKLNIFDLEEENVFALDDFFELNIKDIPSLKSIKYLILDGNNISSFGVKFILSLCPNVEFLSLQGCQQINRKFVNKLKEENPKMTIKWLKSKY